MIRESELELLQVVGLADSVRVVNTNGESRSTAVSNLAQTIVENYEGLEVDGEYKTITEVIGDLKREADGTDSDLGELSETVRGVSQDLGSLSQDVSRVDTNVQALSLEVAAIVNAMHPVGSYYHTSETPEVFHPGTAWGGTWELLGEGQVLLAGSADGAYRVGNQYGSNTHAHSTANHTLTINEMPSHGHLKTAATVRTYGTNEANKGTASWAWGSYEALGNLLQNAGGDQPHNHGDTGNASTMQLSTACYIWHRTA